MTGDTALFGDDEPIALPAPVRAPSPTADWQVDLLRKALNVRKLTSMAVRQRAIEDAAFRRHLAWRSVVRDNVRTVKETSRVLGFHVSEFEDAEW